MAWTFLSIPFCTALGPRISPPEVQEVLAGTLLSSRDRRVSSVGHQEY